MIHFRSCLLLLSSLAILSASNAKQDDRFQLSGAGGAGINCPGGLVSLEHIFDESNSQFEGDPLTSITLATTVAEDGYQVEEIRMGTHTGTHLDSPGHFHEGGRFVDQLRPDELIMRAYIIDVRGRMASGLEPVDFQLSVSDITAYERKNGRIPQGSLVIIKTGFDQFFGTPAFENDAPGFSGDAVQWLVDERLVKGIGSDTFGPDATSDLDFSATSTILLNDRIAIPGLNNLDLIRNGDIIMAFPVRLGNGSGFQVNPVACLGKRSRG